MKILSILPLLLFATIVVNAQELVSYRGAFAPAPTRQWTESWTEFNPQTVAYPTPNVTVNSSISVNTTWTANNVYLLDGVIYVDNNATLTIEPGTVIRGTRGNRSCLVITRGAKLLAEGTQCKPIVFTSNQTPNNRVGGDWAGIVLLGKARNNLGQNSNIEGLPNTDPRNLFGGDGSAENDNSGILKYVRIEFAGDILSVTATGNELNSLTMGSVGSGTVLDYIQCSFGLDDSFEWFGGTVNAKHLIAYKGLDDDLDTDNGYSGTVQYVLCIKDPTLSDASQSEGFESDNSATGIDGLLPKTSAKFFNVTQIGAFRCATNAGPGIVPNFAPNRHRRGARVRRNSDLKIQNSILMNNYRGLFVDNGVVSGSVTAPTTVNYNEDSAVYRNNIIAGDFTTTWVADSAYNNTKSLAYENSASRTIGTNLLYANDSINTCDLLVDPWNVNPNAADFRPNAGVGAVVTNVNLISNGADLSPIVIIPSTIFTAAPQNFIAAVLENGSAATSGTVSITLFLTPGWDYTFNPLATVDGDGNPIQNNLWNWPAANPLATSITITSKPGTIIAKGDNAQLGLTATVKPGTPIGTNQNLNVDVNGGGDVTPGNNSTLVGFSR